MKLIRTIMLGGALIALGTIGTQAQETLKIGAIGSLSGGGTAWGLAIQRGTELAIDEANAAGGVKIGDKSYKIELIMYDDQYNAQGGKTAAERLVHQDKVKFIIGPIGSGPVLSTVSVTTDAEVLVLSNGYAPGILRNDKKAPYNFRMTNTNDEYSEAFVKWVKEDLPNTKKIGFIVPNDAIGQQVAPGLKKIYEANGIEVFYEMYERGSKEFIPLLTRMIAARVDTFDVNFNAPGEAGLLVRQARQAGFRGPIIQAGGPSVPEIFEVAGALAKGFLSYEMFDFSSEIGQKLSKAYEAKYGKGIINSQLPAFYNATRILFEALKRAGTTTDVKKVRDQVEALEGWDTGIYGPVRWTGTEKYGVKHQLLLPFYIVELQEDGTTKTRARVVP